MRRSTKDDAYDWFGALEKASAEARELRDPSAPAPAVACLCGSTDTRGRITTEAVDLSDANVTCVRNEGIRPCRACQHSIHHGAMCVQRHFGPTTAVRDHFHPECVRL